VRCRFLQSQEVGLFFAILNVLLAQLKSSTSPS
jgi:hypothetical protein